MAPALVRSWPIDAGTDVSCCGALTVRFAREAGLDEQAAWALGIAASELASNIVKFAGRGRLTLSRLTAPRPGVEVVAEDSGPGVPDAAIVFADGYSEGRFLAGDEDPRRLRGRGVGLGAVRRLTDDVQLQNLVPSGLRVAARRWARVPGR